MLDVLLHQEATADTEWPYTSKSCCKDGNKSKDEGTSPPTCNHPLISMEDIFDPRDIISTPPPLETLSDDWSFASPTSDPTVSNTRPHQYFELTDPDVYLTGGGPHLLNTPQYYHDMDDGEEDKIQQLSDHNYSHRCSADKTTASAVAGGETSSMQLVGESDGLLADMLPDDGDDKQSCDRNSADGYMGGLDDISIDDLFQDDYMTASCSSTRPSSPVSTTCNSPQLPSPDEEEGKTPGKQPPHKEYARKRRRNNEACRESRKKKKCERVDNEKMVLDLTDHNAEMRLQITKLEAERDEVRKVLLERMSATAASS